MTEIELRQGGLTVSYDATAERLSFARASKKLPWDLDLGATSSVTVRRRTPGAADERHAIRLGALTLRRLSVNHLQWIGEVGGAGIALDVELSEGGLVFTVSPIGTGDAEIISAMWPGELRMKAAEREACWSDYHQGALFRADGKSFETKFDWDNHAMRFYAFTADAHTLAVIVDTSFDAETTLSDDGKSMMRSSIGFLPSLGTLRTPRRVRFVATESSGVVAAAGAFREYAQKNGMWKSFDERVAENPEVAKLRGAFIACAGYYWDDGADQVAAMKAMRAYGFKRAWFFSPKLLCFGTEWNTFGADRNHMTDDQLREIQSLGYLCAPFLQVEETDLSVGAEKFAVDEKGEKILRWQIGQGKYWELSKGRIPAMLPQFDDQLQACAGIHFDTLTAMPLAEDWGPSGYDRAGDARLRMDVADYYRRRGKVILSECMRDWAIPHVDLTTAKLFTPIRRSDGRVWNVPLTDLVYHDSMPRTHWEHHSYDDAHNVRELLQLRFHPFGMELNDLLAASPPVLFPEGTLYHYDLKPITLPDGTPEVEVDWTSARLYRKRLSDPETQAALPKALRVCRLNERHGVARMTSHRFVDPRSPFVQETEFDSGLHVTVNFSDAGFTLPDGRTVGARGSIVEE